MPVGPSSRATANYTQVPGASGILIALCHGLLLGALGLLAWRYATPLGSPVNVGFPPAPPMNDGETGYMFVVDGYIYTDGPHWFPAAAWFLAAGTAAALAISALLVRTRWILVRGVQHESVERWPIVAGLSAFGALCGLAVSIAGRFAPPRQYFVVESEPRDSRNPYPDIDLMHYDVTPTWATFTAVGAASGLVLGSALLFANVRAVRTGRGAQ